MPIRKSVLNRAEQGRYLAATKELHTAGIEVDISEARFQDSPFLDVAVAGGPATGAVDLPNGGVGYAIWVRLVAMRHRVIVPHFRITTKWDDQISLLDFDERGPICKLGWLSYSRNDVLNRHFENSLRFHYRGQLIEGTILATGLQPIPAAYRTGMRVAVRLTFADSLAHEIEVEAQLYVNRMSKIKNAALRLGRGLYEPLAQRETDAVLPQDFRVPHRQHLETGNPEESE